MQKIIFILATLISSTGHLMAVGGNEHEPADFQEIPTAPHEIRNNNAFQNLLINNASSRIQVEIVPYLNAENVKQFHWDVLDTVYIRTKTGQDALNILPHLSVIPRIYLLIDECINQDSKDWLKSYGVTRQKEGKSFTYHYSNVISLQPELDQNEDEFASVSLFYVLASLVRKLNENDRKYFVNYYEKPTDETFKAMYRASLLSRSKLTYAERVSLIDGLLLFPDERVLNMMNRLQRLIHHRTKPKAGDDDYDDIIDLLKILTDEDADWVVDMAIKYLYDTDPDMVSDIKDLCGLVGCKAATEMTLKLQRAEKKRMAKIRETESKQ